MKIAFVVDQIISCGGIIVPFEYCQELRKRGHDAVIMANGRNEELQRAYPTVPVELITDTSDVVIAVWWPQCEKLKDFKGRKIQFVQGNDLKAYTGDDWKQRCLKTRQDIQWDIIAVSKYAGEWTGRDYKVIPNGINERFFKKLNIERDIDILLEGNNEPNKRIDEAYEIARRVGGRIAWLGRETKQLNGVETFSNPPQEKIPKIYQRAKALLKLSHSEGFGLPYLEAMASGCLVVCNNAGGNMDFCDFGWNCLEASETTVKFAFENDLEYMKENACKTAESYTWGKSTDKLLDFINGNRNKSSN